MHIILMIILIISLNNTSDANIGSKTGMDIPRYISLKSDNANIRIGPSKNYPIVLKYIQKYYPLKVIDEYEEWRKVEDFKKNIGWIHKSLISGKRTGLILSNDERNIKVFNSVNGKAIGHIGKGNIVFINKCKINWCLISLESSKGWIKKRHIWGVKKEEIFKIGYFQVFEELYWKSINFVENIKSSL